MRYLSSIFMQNGGSCRPLTTQHTGLNGEFWANTNISISSYKGNIISNTRLANYTYIPLFASDKVMRIEFSGDSIISSCNAIGPIDSKLLVYDVFGKNALNWGSVSFTGLEDVRLVVWNDILYGIGFRPDVIQNKVIAQLIEYNDDFTINHSWFLNTNKYMEKNWQPVEDKPFTFMYDPDKSSLLVLDIDKLHVADDNNMPTIINEIQTQDFTHILSGSSQVIKLTNDWYLSICHTSHRYKDGNMYDHWVYNHYFVIYDKDMNKVWQSVPFRFVCDCMEFTCGMCGNNDNIYISFSMYDGITHLLSIPIDNFLNILMTLRDNPEAYEGEPNIEYMVGSYDSNKTGGPDTLIYMLFLENLHRLDNIGESNRLLLASLSHINEIHDEVLLYFITRRTDCNHLLKEIIQR